MITVIDYYIVLIIIWI